MRLAKPSRPLATALLVCLLALLALPALPAAARPVTAQTAATAQAVGWAGWFDDVAHGLAAFWDSMVSIFGGRSPGRTPTAEIDPNGHKVF